MPGKRHTNKEIMEKLDIIDKKQDVSGYYGWYFIGIALVIASASFAIASQYNLSVSLFIIGAALITFGWYKADKIEKEIKKNKCFKEGVILWSSLRKYVPEGWFLLSTITICVGFCFLIYGAIITNTLIISDAVISFIALIVSVGLGVISIGIAFLSIGFSHESDKRMKSIANATFMEIGDNLQNRFLEIQGNLTDLKTRKSHIWQWRTNIARLIELVKWIKPDYQDRITWSFKSFLEELPWHSIQNREVLELLFACTGIWLLNMGEQSRNELKRLLESHIGKFEEDEDIDTYVQRIEKKISFKDEYSPFQKDD